MFSDIAYAVTGSFARAVATPCEGEPGTPYGVASVVVCVLVAHIALWVVVVPSLEAGA